MMRLRLPSLPRLLAAVMQSERGSVAIETAFVAPVLLALALGGIEAGYAIARQTELQSAAAEAAAIVLAKPPETATDRATIRNIVKTSADVQSWNVWVAEIYRCGTDANYVSSQDSCEENESVATYFYLFIWDRYTPVWAEYGLGDPFFFRVSRTIRIK